MRSMAMASLSVRWITTSRTDHFPGPGRAVNSWNDSPATARRSFAPPAAYCSITVPPIGPSCDRPPPALVPPFRLDAADAQPVPRVPALPPRGLGQPVLGLGAPAAD